MLGHVRTKAAPFIVALIAAFAFQTSGILAPREAAAATKKKKKAKPAPAEDSLTPPTEEDSDDIEITTIDPGTTKKPPPPPPKSQKKKGKKGKTAEVVPEEVELEEEPEAPPPEVEPAPRYRKNWGSLTIQQDFLSFSTQANVCPSTTAAGAIVPGADQYSCHDKAGGLYRGPVVNGLGNTVQGGFGMASTRILLGYDRVFIDRLTVGGRLGWAFGMTPAAEGDGSAVPLHVEVRSAFYFGSAPFERRSIRPFASVGAGLGEVDSSVDVEVYQAPEGPVTTVEAWRKTGRGFLGLGGGAAYPVGDFTVNAELRALLMIGAPAFALGLSVGAAYGF